jgi:hypothetical protein
MGNFYVNYTTFGPEREGVANCLRSMKRKAFVSPTLDGITVFFDEESDSQDDAVIKDLGIHASKDLRAPVLAVLNHDDDILAYWLFEAGQIADEHNSLPGYFTGGDETPTGGDSKKLCAAFGANAKTKQVDDVLRESNEKYAFALDRHKDLGELLNHPWAYVCMGYRYIKEGSLAEGVNQEDLLANG